MDLMRVQESAGASNTQAVEVMKTGLLLSRSVMLSVRICAVCLLIVEAVQLSSQEKEEEKKESTAISELLYS